jgi:hypothetical protein
LLGDIVQFVWRPRDPLPSLLPRLLLTLMLVPGNLVPAIELQHGDLIQFIEVIDIPCYGFVYFWLSIGSQSSRWCSIPLNMLDTATRN